MKKDILGIKIDDVSIDEATKIVEGWLGKSEKHYVLTKLKGKVLRARSKISHTEARAGFYIVTPNPEIVVMAQKDNELKKVINQADLAIPDGIGLKLSGDIVCYTPGVDLMERLILMAQENAFRVGLLGGQDGVAERAAQRLLREYPDLKITFAESGGEVDDQGDGGNWGNWGRADLLFVAFGPPKQEKWIAKNLPKIKVKVAMGVGGAFDYLSGSIPRAPKWVRNLGFEWLFRLILQPWRLKRQLTLLKYIWLLTKR